MTRDKKVVVVLPSEDDFAGATFYTVAEGPQCMRLVLRCQTGQKWDIIGDHLRGAVNVINHARAPMHEAPATLLCADDVAAAILAVLDIVDHTFGQMDYVRTIFQILRTAEENT